jgi:hypothetical protein
MTIKIGDWVFVATYGVQAKQIRCPHCLGTKFCTVIIATGEEFTVDCGSCSRAYEGSVGTITVYDYTPEVKNVQIDKIEVTSEGNQYYSRFYTYDNSKVFLNKEDAEKEAEILTEKQRQEQADKIQRKEKDTKSWAWNASYHKKAIEKAKKDIEYHSAKLDAAKLKVKVGAK